jgi:hypothetical protein
LETLKWRGVLVSRPSINAEARGREGAKKKIKLCGTGGISGVFEGFTAENTEYAESQGSCGDLFVGGVV